jgi:hypothetical protein
MLGLVDPTHNSEAMSRPPPSKAEKVVRNELTLGRLLLQDGRESVTD